MRKNDFEHAQNVRIQIILHMRKVSSGHLFPTKNFYFYFVDSEDPGQPARMLIWAYAVRICPKIHVCMAQLITVARRMERAVMQFADNACPDQPAHSRRLIKAFVVRLQNQWIL